MLESNVGSVSKPEHNLSLELGRTRSFSVALEVKTFYGQFFSILELVSKQVIRTYQCDMGISRAHIAQDLLKLNETLE